MKNSTTKGIISRKKKNKTKQLQFSIHNTNYYNNLANNMEVKQKKFMYRFYIDITC